MAPAFTPVSGKKMIKILEKEGYRILRTKGSHVRLEHSERKKVTVPMHKELGTGLTLKILKDAEISQEKFLKLLEQ